MEQLKRWREERAARRTSGRLLRGSAATPTEIATTFAAPAAELVVRETRRERRLANAPKARLHFWPESERISPVHPKWDIPRNKRLRGGLYTSMGFHALMLPLALLVTHFDFSWLEKREENKERVFAIVNMTTPLPPVKGQGGEGLRAIKNDPPKAKPDPPKPTPPKIAKAPAPKAPTAKPAVKPPAPVDPHNAHPLPVPDQAQGTKPVEGPTPSVIADDVVVGPLLAGKGPVPGSKASIGGVDGVDFPYNYYLEIIRQRIAQAWKVPEGIVPPGKRIEAQVSFRIQRDGTLMRQTVEIPSGRSDYDQAALRAVQDGRPFPPLPPAFGGEYLTVHFQFTYQGR